VTFFIYTILKKRILVTGAAGAVGLETLKELQKRNDKYKIIAFGKDKKEHRRILKNCCNGIDAIYGDIRDKKTTDKLSENIDFVIHLAAVIPPLADEFPKLTEEVNLGGTKNLISSLEEKSPNAFFLYTSSVAVYGDRLETPVIRVGDKLGPSIGDDYAATKVKAEKLVGKSKLNWSIFRLTAIMSPKQKFNPLMFHMPLDTKMEICTTKDTAFALVQAIENRQALNKKTFNLGGGKTCRVSFIDFLKTNTKNSGLGEMPFPENAFAKGNFHCGYYADSDELNKILNFQRETLEDYYEQFKKEIGPLKITLARIFKPFIVSYFLSKSDPLKAVKNNDQKMIERFFPKSH